ncbi:MAG: bifunctional DNA-formamidopyrimidine glycosylase/DNA-(apurinic or apyrimidinic site) lyase [Chloroflexota bacterium]
MPELPEVETIRRDLARALTGRRFVDVDLLWPGVVRHPSPEDFQRCLVGQRIREVARRGKYLLIRLDSGDNLAMHLKMSGSLLLRSPSSALDSYLRAVLTLDDGNQLRFYDPRKFGGMWLVAEEEAITCKLGPEPFDAAFTPEVLHSRLVRRAVPIKALLCDQFCLAGVGNIYADEALCDARIHPLRKAKDITLEEAERLHAAIRSVLERAIGNRGTTFRKESLTNQYRDAYGEAGRNEDALLVTRRAGAPCSCCGTPLQRIPIRGRGTYFCPDCQR